MGTHAQLAGIPTLTHCPLSTPEDWLLYILPSLQTSCCQVLRGRLFGMDHSQANPWIHLLLVVLQATRRPPPSCGHEGMEQRLERPQDLLEQLRGDRGQNTGHTVKHVWLIKAVLTILFLSGTSAGRTHDSGSRRPRRLPVPVGCRWLQDLDCLAFTRNQVEILMPTKPRGQALTRVQKATYQRMARRRVCIEPVNSCVIRYRIVHGISRRRKAGVHELVRKLTRMYLTVGCVSYPGI